MVGARASRTFSNGHFCSAFFICLGRGLPRRQAKLSTSFCKAGGRRAIRPGIASKKVRSATIGASTARMPHFLVGLGHRRQALDRGQRELGGKVVGGGAALQHHLRRADHGGEILVLEVAADIDPLAARQQQFERPAVVQHPCRGCPARGCGR